MKSLIPLLQIELNFSDFKFGLLCFISAFAIAMVCIPPIIRLVDKYRLHDIPDSRKEHSLPTPTLGGIAIIVGMTLSIALWFPFSFSSEMMICFFSMAILGAMGMTDDLNDLSPKYKFIVEIALASLIALSGIRINTFGGLFGLNELPITAQYSFTILAIVGIINAFNFIDGIDGLAAGMGFMSLITIGIFLTIGNDKSFALIAFALAGSILGFLFFNMNPAKIFMGDTGSLVVGFILSILCTRFIQGNSNAAQPIIKAAPLFALGMVLMDHEFDFKAADRHFRRALKLNPNNAVTRYYLAEAYETANRNADAKKQIEAIMMLTPDPKYIAEHKDAVEKARKLQEKIRSSSA